MTITVRWYNNKPNTFDPDYDNAHVKSISGETAAEIMAAIRFIKNNNDLVLFTPVEIINVED